MYILANYLSHLVKRGLETSDMAIKDYHPEIVDWKDNKGKDFHTYQNRHGLFTSTELWPPAILKLQVVKNLSKGSRAESGELFELGSIELLVIFFVGGTFIAHLFAWCWSQVKMSKCTRKHRPATIFEHQLYNYY